MTNTFDFNSRETYLAYRADWKVRYRVASQDIRDTKAAIREANALGYHNSASGHQSTLVAERKAANELMKELAEAKEFKNQQLAAVAA